MWRQHVHYSLAIHSSKLFRTRDKNVKEMCQIPCAMQSESIHAEPHTHPRVDDTSIAPYGIPAKKSEENSRYLDQWSMIGER